jgi:hypothetical protein
MLDTTVLTIQFTPQIHGDHASPRLTCDCGHSLGLGVVEGGSGVYIASDCYTCK